MRVVGSDDEGGSVCRLRFWRGVEVKWVLTGVGLNKRGEFILWSGLDSLVGWGMDL